MTHGLKAIGAVVLVLCGAGPVAADVTTLTCSDFAAMDAAGKQSAAAEILAWIATSENSTEAPNLIAKYASPTEGDAWAPDTFVIEIEGHCQDAAPGMGVIARLDQHS